MSDVKQTIQVTNAELSPILSIAQGTGMVEFEFTVSDFQIPAGSTAVAHNIQPTGNIVSQVCTLVGNVITVTPPAYYFLRGKNYMQIQVTGADSANLFTFLIEVWCSPNISAPVVSQNPDLISQLMAMIGNTQDLDTTAKNNLVAAINEIYGRGVVDILDTEEEIEANTDTGKATGALVTKQLISEFIAQNWVPYNGYDPFGATALLQVFSVNEGSKIAQGVPPGLSPYATVICFGKAEYGVLWYVDVFGATATYSTNQNRWIVPTSAKTLLRANVTGSGSIDVKSVLPNWANLSVDDFIFNTTHIALNMSGWGHPSDKQPDPANADFYPIEKSYSNGVLTYNIKPTSISVGQYGQVAGATTNITPYCDIYA